MAEPEPVVRVVRIDGARGACLVFEVPEGLVRVDGKDVLAVELARQVATCIGESTGVSTAVVPRGFVRITLLAPGGQAHDA